MLAFATAPQPATAQEKRGRKKREKEGKKKTLMFILKARSVLTVPARSGLQLGNLTNYRSATLTLGNKALVLPVYLCCC